MSKLNPIFHLLSPDFNKNYHTPACDEPSNYSAAVELTTAATTTVASTAESVLNSTADLLHDDHDYVYECLRENSLLFLLLVLGTAWLGLSLFNFTKTYVPLFRCF